MLTEGWDANTVTHVLGVRAFGTQLLCEQVIGRALRRQSYDLNDDGLFNVEYADVPSPALAASQIQRRATVLLSDRSG
jgi:type III restriction enzyme